MAGEVVHVADGVPGAVYIGRPGKGKRGPFGNPVVPGRRCPECGETHGRDAGNLACYRRWLWRRLQTDSEFRRAVRGLHGKPLACFCVRRGAQGTCHGFVLLAAVEWLQTQGA